MNKKGFTLMELIAVVIVLAIIALVAVPRITSAIEAAKEKATIASVQNYMRALDEKIMNENIQDGTYDDTELVVDVAGDKPDSATIVVYNRGVVELHANYNNIPVSYNKEDGFRVIKYEVYKPGDVISYDVSTGKKCSTPSTDLTSKTGCMKFYVITTDDTKDKDYIDVILDHNTTAEASWNEDKVNQTSNREIKEASQILASDTNGWITYPSTSPRVISVSEILEITNNNTFDYATANYTEWFYFDSKNHTKVTSTSKKSKYWWLFDNTNGCLSYGCNNDYAGTYGYWTMDTVKEFVSNEWYLAWRISYEGALVTKDGTWANQIGIRPVIKISKKVLENE